MNATRREARAVVIGLGNPDCADDGAGPLAASMLTGLAHTRVISRRGDPLLLIEEWAHADTVVLIDAAASGSPPGTIHRFDVSLQELPHDFPLPSTHAFGLAETLALARALGKLPRRAVLYAIEAARFAPGTAMTAEVAAAARRAARLVASDLHDPLAYAQVRIGTTDDA